MVIFQITLRAIRISCGYTGDEVARCCDVPVGDINKAEIDSSEMAYSLLSKMADLYKVAIDRIYLGPEGNERVT